MHPFAPATARLIGPLHFRSPLSERAESTLLERVRPKSPPFEPHASSRVKNDVGRFDRLSRCNGFIPRADKLPYPRTIPRDGIFPLHRLKDSVRPVACLESQAHGPGKGTVRIASPHLWIQRCNSLQRYLFFSFPQMWIKRGSAKGFPRFFKMLQAA